MTVRIEEEAAAATLAEEFVTDDPAFGIWRDREDMADIRFESPRGTAVVESAVPELAKLAEILWLCSR